MSKKLSPRQRELIQKELDFSGKLAYNIHVSERLREEMIMQNWFTQLLFPFESWRIRRGLDQRMPG